MVGAKQVRHSEAFARFAAILRQGNCLLREVVKGAYNRRLLYQLRRQSSQLPPLRRFPPLREGNQAGRVFGSPCEQGEPEGGGLHSHSFLRTMARRLVL